MVDGLGDERLEIVVVVEGLAAALFCHRLRPQLRHPQTDDAARIHGGDGDLLGGKELIDVHQAMHQGHVSVAPAVAPVAHEGDGNAGDKPEEVLSALDAGDIDGDLVERFDGEPVLRVPIHLDSRQSQLHVGSIVAERAQQHGPVGGESLHHVRAALRKQEDGDLGALRHLIEVLSGALQRAEDRDRIGVQRVDEEDVDRAAGRRRLAVGIDPRL